MYGRRTHLSRIDIFDPAQRPSSSGHRTTVDRDERCEGKQADGETQARRDHSVPLWSAFHRSASQPDEAEHEQQRTDRKRDEPERREREPGWTTERLAA
jgi:hypothetical protein